MAKNRMQHSLRCLNYVIYEAQQQKQWQEEKGERGEENASMENKRESKQKSGK